MILIASHIRADVNLQIYEGVCKLGESHHFRQDFTTINSRVEDDCRGDFLSWHAFYEELACMSRSFTTCHFLGDPSFFYLVLAKSMPMETLYQIRYLIWETATNAAMFAFVRCVLFVLLLANGRMYKQLFRVIS